MSARLVGGLALAIGSACALNLGFFVQHDAASSMVPLSVRRPIASLRALFGNRRWLAGYGAGIGGWALYIAALSLAPLSIVQAASAGGIGVLALMVWRVGGVTPTRREELGISAAMIGLASLGISLGAFHARTTHPSSGPLALWIAVSLIGAGGVAVLAARAHVKAAGLGAASGILYAGGDVATKAAFATPHHLAFFAVLAVSHGLGFVAIQQAFQLGGALETAGISSLLTNALPIAGGIILFYDQVPGGLLGILRIASFGLILVAAVLLARALPTVDDRVVALTRERGAQRPR